MPQDWLSKFVFISFLSAVAGAAATLCHDAAMNPVDGKESCGLCSLFTMKHH